MVSVPRFFLLLLAIFATGVARAEYAMMPSSALSLSTALADARMIAETRPGSEVLRIEGVSMLPFFGQGSVVIVKKIDPAKLRAGMVVVYTNRFGETVAHRLVAATEAGWVAQGYNNADVDSTPVTAANLRGVVYATFHSNGQLDPNAGLTDVAVALAAPAR